MRSDLVLALVLSTAASLGACAAKKGPETCVPTSSFALPTYRCTPTTSAVVAAVDPTPTAEPAPALPEVQADVITLRDKVQFETDSTTLTAPSRTLLDELAKTLQDHPEIEKVRIEGHTDSTSTREHNQQLSDGRAMSVRTYLIAKGVDAARLIPKGFGQDKPVGDNATEDGRYQNRRVEFHITQRKK